jgi:hypothetical protein
LEEIAFAVVSKPYEEWKFYDSTSSEEYAHPPGPKNPFGHTASEQKSMAKNWREGKR